MTMTTCPHMAIFQPEEDEAAKPFTPSVNLVNRPWFHDEGSPAVVVEATKNVTLALREVPLQKQREMGHKVEDLIQECSWNGRPCSPL